MKKLLPLLLLILIGCSNPEPLNFHLLEERDGVYYREDTNEIHSGPVFTLYPDEKFHIIFEESTLKDGKLHGSYKSYYENGQIQEEGTFKDDKKNGLWKSYHENGKVKLEEIYKDGELIESKEY